VAIAADASRRRALAGERRPFVEVTVTVDPVSPGIAPSPLAHPEPQYTGRWRVHMRGRPQAAD